jgi:hypothetical protein
MNSIDSRGSAAAAEAFGPPGVAARLMLPGKVARPFGDGVSAADADAIATTLITNASA